MTAKNGMTLYVFDEDHGKKSACYGFCAVEWPPYYAHKGDSAGKGWSIVARSSGWLQWAWRGRLVYFYAPDKKPGDVKGYSVDGTWHIARH